MVDHSDQYSPNDIAIVGMALRVPGARNVGEFWSNLRNGVESIRDLSEAELLAAGESPSRLQQANYVRRAAELPAMEMFDAEFFGLSPKEAAIMDPQHRQFLECAWEAMEDAGRTPDSSEGPVGVFAGCGMGSYFYFNVCSNAELVAQTGMFLLRHTGNDKDFLATRASFSFDLRGPSINVQTACSTSLVAVHMACQSLLAGECESAIAGGVTIEIPHRRGYLYQDGEILSPDGHCRAFDHRAGGTVFGSGVGVVMLRRLVDAMADGDIIHGIVRGTAVNNDGASKASYLAPSVTGQAEAIIEAQGLAGVDADSIQYVECHGTGTYLGDPIEVEALTQAFRQSTNRTGFCRIGSVKSNIGHLDTAAGVVSLIKATLAIKHSEMPPTLGFDKPNPAIDFARSPFIVNDTLTPWPKVTGPRRAAVNSLGVGGTNAHFIIEQAPTIAQAQLAASRPELLVFAARNRKALDTAMSQLGTALEQRPDLSLADAAHTMFAGRKHFEHRRVIAVRDRAEAIALLGTPDTKRAFSHNAIEAPGGPVFLFPGGGAQHVGMARRLYGEDAAFAASIDEALAALDGQAAAEIRQVWLDDDVDAAQTLFLRPSVQLPAILMVEVAVARYWMRHELQPAALIGHSMGENAAACIAGVISLADAMALVRLRGELFDTIALGGMLSVPLASEKVIAMLPDALDLASVNAPELCVVSGRNEDLEAFRAVLSGHGIDASRVPIDIAAHSAMLEPILLRFEAFLRSIRLNAPAIPIVSNLTGAWLTEAQARDPVYWVRHLRSTVQFSRGMALLAQQSNRVFIEVGPGRALSSLVKLQPGIAANQVINSLPHADDATDDRLHLLAALGRAWATGMPIPLAKLWEGRGARRVSLPTYPFTQQRYFIEPSLAATLPQAADTAPIRNEDIVEWGYRPSWTQSLPEFTSGADRVPTGFLVFLDDTGFGTDLVADLRSVGHTVTTVRVGDTFARLDAGDYVLRPEDGAAGYAALLSGLAGDGGVPPHILHLWLLTTAETFRPGSNFFNRNQEQGFYSLFHLTQALGEIGHDEQTQITVVGNGMQRVDHEALPYPEKATVLGPALVIPKEMTNINVKLIDLELPENRIATKRLFARRPSENMDTGAALRMLIEDLFATASSDLIAYRGGRRWTRSYQAMPLVEPDMEAIGFREHGVYLITGGLGDLALVMARALTSRFAARVVLTGRSTLPLRGEWPLYLRTHSRSDRLRHAIEQLQALEAEGHQVLYLQGDVANTEDMERVIATAQSRFGPINGVLHTAGIVDDDLIAMKDVATIEQVLAPKLHGTTVLDRLFADVPLDLFVLFSSTSTDTAPAGQVDYVAANAYLNAYAEAQAWRVDRKTIAVHWGVWSEVGLAARALSIGNAALVENRVIGAAQGPFFSDWVEDAEGLMHLEGDIGPATHWLLDEHRMVSGQAVLPGTGYVEVIAQAAREYGLGEPYRIDELMFLRALGVADGQAKTLSVTLRAEAGGYRVDIAAGDATIGMVTHASAVLRPEADTPPAVDVKQIGTRLSLSQTDDGEPALPSIQAGHMRFGPRWQVLRAAAFGAGEAVADLRLDAAFNEDRQTGVLLHPALLDIATGFAMQIAPGYTGSDVLWVPISYGRITVHAALPDHVLSHVRLSVGSAADAGYASFDVTIVDRDGIVLLDIERFMMKRLDEDALPVTSNQNPIGGSKPHAVQASVSPATIKLAQQVRQGIREGEGFEALLRALGSGQPQPIISSMDLGTLRKAAARPDVQAAAAHNTFERPDLDSDFVAPSTEVEQTLAKFWRELLGVDKIGVNDSFFDIGGHSLIAVRLFRMIRQAYAVDLPISVLFNAPTIAACAALIAAQTEPKAESADAAEAALVQADHIHLVAMSNASPRGKTPFFLCAGMFGNLLNLRQLALHIGTSRPVYGLQARGLYGEQAPHESFAEAARDYLAEIRTVQPHGPYMLGGFSGGGLIAYEMAQQLRAAGEEVSSVIMLDTPLPTQFDLSALDKLSMKLQDIRRAGPAYLMEWARSRRSWAAQLQHNQDALENQGSSTQFHNALIEAAFRAALMRYKVESYAGKTTLFRPKLEIIYRLSGGRQLQPGRNPAMDDNGWGPFVSDLEVQEVPGDHDSMVLEPFVRVLSSRIRRVLDEADSTAAPMRLAAE